MKEETKGEVEIEGCSKPQEKKKMKGDFVDCCCSQMSSLTLNLCCVLRGSKNLFCASRRIFWPDPGTIFLVAFSFILVAIVRQDKKKKLLYIVWNFLDEGMKTCSSSKFRTKLLSFVSSSTALLSLSLFDPAWPSVSLSLSLSLSPLPLRTEK